MALACKLRKLYKTASGDGPHVVRAASILAKALEGYVEQLAANSGLAAASTIAQLRAAHQNNPNSFLGIDGRSGTICDMLERKIFLPQQTLHTILSNAVQAVEAILRIDAIVQTPLAKPPAQLPF